MAPVEFRGDLWRQKTRVPGLSCGFCVCVILRFAVLLEHRLVTDRHGHRPMASTLEEFNVRRFAVIREEIRSRAL